MPDKRFTDSVKFVHEYVHNYVEMAVKLHKEGLKQEKAEDGEPSRYVFLKELAKTGYNEKKIQDELLNILLAGRDTTASLLSYLFYILARRPDVFAKLRAEVMQIGSERPSFEQIKSMKYLQYSLNESQSSLLPLVALPVLIPFSPQVVPHRARKRSNRCERYNPSSGRRA